MLCLLPLTVVLALPGEVDAPGGLVHPKNGGFSIRFPGKPKESTQSTSTPVGKLSIYTATFALPDGSVFLASFAEFPAEAVKPDVRGTLFDGVVKGLTAKNGKAVSEKEIEIGKEKGREVLIDKGKQQMRFRLVVKDNRLIQFAAIGAGEFIKSREATAFLDSLEFQP
jgi:hypothetical protein